MKVYLMALLLLSSDPFEIAKVNRLKREAKEAFNGGDYELAATKYDFLIDSLGQENPGAYMNLAHSYYHLGDTARARTNYEYLVGGSDKSLKSTAHQQLGVMAKENNQLPKALNHLKAAIKANVRNQEARFNYEVVKKLLDKQQEEQQNQENKDDQQNQDQQDQENQDQQNQENQDQQNQDQQNQDQQDQDQQDQQNQEQDQEGEQEGEQDEQQQQDGEQQDQQEGEQDQNPSTQQKLEEMNISEEKARMILEAMKNNEVQYIQQQRRKSTKQPDTGKPDW